MSEKGNKQLGFFKNLYLVVYDNKIIYNKTKVMN